MSTAGGGRLLLAMAISLFCFLADLAAAVVVLAWHRAGSTVYIADKWRLLHTCEIVLHHLKRACQCHVVYTPLQLDDEQKSHGQLSNRYPSGDGLIGRG